MEDILRALKTFEVWIYLLLGLGGIIFAAKFASGWNELRQSAFGLERESAQNRVNRAASALLLLAFAAMAEFAVVSFVVPTVPGANALPTATLNLLATPTTTLAAEETAPATTPEPPPVANQEGCVPDQVILTAPQNGSTVQGIASVEGTANIVNFGFYKFEMSTQEDEDWVSIQAGDSIVTNDLLGNWDTTRLNPGIYRLRLVVTDNQGLALPACIVTVNVSPP